MSEINTRMTLFLTKIVFPYIEENRSKIVKAIEKNMAEDIFREIFKTCFSNSQTKEILGEKLYNEFIQNLDSIIEASMKTHDVINGLNSLSEQYLN